MMSTYSLIKTNRPKFDKTLEYKSMVKKAWANISKLQVGGRKWITDK